MVKTGLGGQRGFTLFEILVSVTILAIAFTSLFRLFGGTLRSIENSQKYSYAVVLGEEMMTKILFDAENFPQESSQQSGIFEDNPDYSYKLNMAPYEKPIGRIEDETTVVTGTKPVTYRINLILNWAEGAKTRSLILETFQTLVRQEE
ncbi:MAG: hypothetical protein IEMM0002_1361 [bacterium]|nr:MAG: hypothetical protein IEMM0002_1361 [bacterium]